ncbi:Hsp70 family protein [Lishizhenia sp.]|uniref:Hsp70 family protein n=1 Tax=Lishizhenia sp. TaxID=2497594 RepID=UPI00299DDDD4|nr:Hsp70 family protein [Lishizhenia sp.]MDX1445853.1 Hsp70 family protein [Lishizhenia sp.]
MLIGIDLGTTFSLAATVGRNGEPILLPDNSNKNLFHTPSAVHIDGDTAYIGNVIEARLEQNPGLPVIRFFKRSFGEKKPLYIDSDQTPWYPESLAALILKKLMIDAETYTSQPVEGAVITVPAHFNDKQRKCVLNAASLINLKVLALLEEPIAAAMHYGIMNKKYDKTILVYDLGGGTFDVSVLTMNAEGIFVMGKDGLTELGGKEFDEAIGQIILEQFKEELGYDLVLDARGLLHLRRISEEIKVELSVPGTTFVEKVCVLGKHSMEVHISRKGFEKAITSLIEQTEEVVQRCIKSVGIDNVDVDTVILVGGSSMIPFIKKRLKALFNGEHQEIHAHEPMKAVTFGAALHAVQLSGKKVDYEIPPELRGVTGYNLGVRAMNPKTGRVVIDNLVKKNMPLPSIKEKTYYTTSEDQKRMRLEIIQYLKKGEEEQSLGNLVIGPLPSNQANYPINVKIENRKDGTVWFRAVDPNSGMEIEKVFGDDEEGGGSLTRQKALVNSTIIIGSV